MAEAESGLLGCIHVDSDLTARLQITKYAISKQVLINCTAVVEMRYRRGGGESRLFCRTAFALLHSDSMIRATYTGRLPRKQDCCVPPFALTSAAAAPARGGAVTHTDFVPVLYFIL